MQMNLNIIKQVFIFPILTYFQNPKDTHYLESSEIYCIQRMLFLVLV